MLDRVRRPRIAVTLWRWWGGRPVGRWCPRHQGAGVLRVTPTCQDHFRKPCSSQGGAGEGKAVWFSHLYLTSISQTSCIFYFSDLYIVTTICKFRYFVWKQNKVFVNVKNYWGAVCFKCAKLLFPLFEVSRKRGCATAWWSLLLCHGVFPRPECTRPVPLRHSSHRDGHRLRCTSLCCTAGPVGRWFHVPPCWNCIFFNTNTLLSCHPHWFVVFKTGMIERTLTTREGLLGLCWAMGKCLKWP